MAVFIMLANLLAVIVNGFVVFVHVYTGNVSWFTYLTACLVLLNFFAFISLLIRVVGEWNEPI